MMKIRRSKKSEEHFMDWNSLDDLTRIYRKTCGHDCMVASFGPCCVDRRGRGRALSIVGEDVCSTCQARIHRESLRIRPPTRLNPWEDKSMRLTHTSQQNSRTDSSSSQPSSTSLESEPMERVYRKECGHRCSVRSFFMCCADMNDLQDDTQVHFENFCTTCRVRSAKGSTVATTAVASIPAADLSVADTANAFTPVAKDGKSTAHENLWKGGRHDSVISSTTAQLKSRSPSDRGTEMYCAPCIDVAHVNAGSVATTYRKACGHTCRLKSTSKCCEDEDMRPIQERERSYEVYVDGVGFSDSAERHDFYCDTCRDRARNRLEEQRRREIDLSRSREAKRLVFPRFIQSVDPSLFNRGTAAGGQRRRQFLNPFRAGTRVTGPSAPASTRRTHRDDAASSEHSGMLMRATQMRATQSSSGARTATVGGLVGGDDNQTASRSCVKVKECGHICMLSSTTLCCADADTRPVRPPYDKYVDGDGYIEAAERHDFYCNVCCDRVRNQEQLEEWRSRTQEASLRSATAAAVASSEALTSATASSVSEVTEAKKDGGGKEEAQYIDEQLSIVTLGEELEAWLSSVTSQLSNCRLALSKAQMMTIPDTSPKIMPQHQQREREQKELAKHLQDSVHHLESVQRLMNTFRSAHGLADVLVSRSASALMGGNVVEDEPPMELCCSLTQEVMMDPVMTHDGQTYERAAIEGWFEQFNKSTFPTSPNTNEALESRKLIPNYALKALCDRHQSRCAAVKAVVVRRKPPPSDGEMC